MSVVETAVNYAIDVANDNSHGYDQIHRWGKDFDCSSLIISSYEKAGLKLRENGASYTGNMKSAFLKCGFEAFNYVKGMRLLRGDVVLCDHYANNKYYGHTLLYLGNGKIVQASINEKGTTKGGKPGDQTGREISVGNFYEYSKGWDCVLRYQWDNKQEMEQETKTVNIELISLTHGMKNEQVKTVQRLLNALGYVGANGKKLTTDGDFGSNTLYAVNKLQQDFLGYHDGIVGQKTWTKLLKG